MLSSTVDSRTVTGWKRRSSAASRSIYLRYSSRVVAPMRLDLATREGGLQDVGGVNRAFGGAGADDGVQLVDKQDAVTRGYGSPR